MTSGLREDSKPVELAGRRDRGARKEGKVAGAAGCVGGSCWSSLRAARADWHCSALLAPLGSLTLPWAVRLCPPQLHRGLTGRRAQRRSANLAERAAHGEGADGEGGAETGVSS